MGDDTRRLSPGERWRPVASVLNDYQEAADYVRDLKTGGGAIPGSGVEPNACIITVKNQSGEDRNRFDVLGIDRPIFTPDDNLAAFTSREAIEGVLPTPDEHAGRWVVLLRPLADGAIGKAVAAGVVKVRVYVNAPDDEYCELIESKTWCDETVYLGTADSGAQILWLETRDCDITHTIVWAIVRLGPPGEPATTTTSTTTTTTADPGIGGCHGTCRWTWSSSSSAWSLDSNGCNTTTTTSTTTTSSDPNTTTTTALPPCECATPTTPEPTTTTTTSEPTTTTTPAPCKCLYPTFCGEIDGECTVTYCAPPEYDSEPPNCSTTTSTSTTTTTGDPGTTTEDPCTASQRTSTTTTVSPVCTRGCDWEWWEWGGWHQTSNGCGSECPCPAPTDAGGPGNCVAHTGCVVLPPPPPPPPPTCSGTCYWSSTASGWHWIGGGCFGTGGCSCPPPSGPPGDCCDHAETQCMFTNGGGGGGSTTTTTYNPCTTTTTPNPNTTTTSTTTTTPDPCIGSCKWQWHQDDKTWSSLKNTCGEGCPCCPPGFDGAADCETAVTSCRKLPCPTTTTSTTTTKPPCSGCGYVCTNHQWVLAYNLCAGECSCHAAPSGPCALNDSRVAYPCNK